MIKSLFRQMWNQRHANVWVWAELVVVIVLLWYGIDLVYNYEAAARQPKGYDTENVFDIQLNIKPILQRDSVLMSRYTEYLEQIYPFFLFSIYFWECWVLSGSGPVKIGVK